MEFKILERAHPTTGLFLRLDPTLGGFVDARGTLVVRVGGRVLDASFAPDGKSFVFAEVITTQEPKSFQVCRVMLEGPAEATETGPVPERCRCWPGNAFAFGDDHALWIADLAGRALKRVPMGVMEARRMVTLSDVLEGASLAVATHGELLLAVQNRKRREVRVLHIRPSWLGMRAVQIAAISGLSTIVKPVWQSGGHRAVLLCVDAERNESSLYLFDVRLRQATKVYLRQSTDPVVPPLWSFGGIHETLLVVHQDGQQGQKIVQVELPSGQLTDLFPVVGVLQRMAWTERRLLLEGEGIAVVEPHVQDTVTLVRNMPPLRTAPVEDRPNAAGQAAAPAGSRPVEARRSPLGDASAPQLAPAHGPDPRGPELAPLLPPATILPPTNPLRRRERNLGGVLTLSFELPGDWLRRPMDERFGSGFKGISYIRTGAGAAALHVLVQEPSAATSGDLFLDVCRRISVVVEDELRPEAWPAGEGAFATASDPLAHWRFMMIEDGGHTLVLIARIPKSDPAARKAQVEMAFRTLQIEGGRGQERPLSVHQTTAQESDAERPAAAPRSLPVRELRTEDLVLPGGDILNVDLTHAFVVHGPDRAEFASAPEPFDVEPVALLTPIDDHDPRTSLRIGWRRAPAGILLVDWLEERARRAGPATAEARPYPGIGLPLGVGMELQWNETLGRCRGRLIAAEAGGNLVLVQISALAATPPHRVAELLTIVESLRLASPAPSTMPVFPTGDLRKSLRNLTLQLERSVASFPPDAPASAQEFIVRRVQPILVDMRRAYTEGVPMPPVVGLRQEAEALLSPIDMGMVEALGAVQELARDLG